MCPTCTLKPLHLSVEGFQGSSYVSIKCSGKGVQGEDSREFSLRPSFWVWHSGTLIYATRIFFPHGLSSPLLWQTIPQFSSFNSSRLLGSWFCMLTAREGLCWRFFWSGPGSVHLSWAGSCVRIHAGGLVRPAGFWWSSCLYGWDAEPSVYMDSYSPAG